MRKLLICLMFTIGLLPNINAQTSNTTGGVTYTEPVLSTTNTTEADRATVYILSPNKDLRITHTMGTSSAVITGRDAENYLYIYELEHIFTADNIEDGFFKTILKISSVSGEKMSPITLKAGKCYDGYFEVPFSFSYTDETTKQGFYAADNKAKVSFISEVNDLYISCNNEKYVENGVAIMPNVEVKVENGLAVYDFIFDTAPLATEFHRPVFTVKSSAHEDLTVELSEDKMITPKSYFQYRIIIANTVFETEYAQALKTGETEEKASNFQGAITFYEQAMALDSLNSLQVEGLALKIDRMNECLTHVLTAKKAFADIRTLMKSGDFSKQKLETNWDVARVCYSNLLKITGNLEYRVMVEKIEKKLENFNYIYVSGTIRDKMSTAVISEGVKIYTTSSSQMGTAALKDIKDKDLYSSDIIETVGADGKFSFRVEKGEYGAQGLIFMPQGDNKKYKSFLSLAPQEDIKTTVYIYTK